jgi:hypothetical protein
MSTYETHVSTLNNLNRELDYTLPYRNSLRWKVGLGLLLCVGGLLAGVLGFVFTERFTFLVVALALMSIGGFICSRALPEAIDTQKRVRQILQSMQDEKKKLRQLAESKS